jgi:hypothetical protein
VRQLLPSANLRVLTDQPGSVVNDDPAVIEAAIGYSRQFPIEEGFRKTIHAVRAKHNLPAV